ncbi:hypothetical protein [Orbus mooreae]|uniref:hypothetical protein n=1 Tax=Orbus mooreae TaxID=3074107 RepID=UPI00370DBA76
MNNVSIKFTENSTILLNCVGGNITLNIGYQTLINKYIKASLPTPYETENIIMIIEDEIARVAVTLPTINKLVSDDSHLKEMINYLHSGNSITTTQVELLFNQFADVISGSPMPVNLPNTLSFIVILIIVRELLHHLNIEGVEVF